METTFVVARATPAANLDRLEGSMSEFQLRFMESGGRTGSPESVPIDASSAQEALSIAKERIGKGTAELLQGDRHLARIRNAGTVDAPLWQIDRSPA